MNYWIPSIVAVVLIVVFLVKKFKVVGGKEISSAVDKAIDIASDILQLLNLNDNVEKSITHILDITDFTASYVGSIVDAQNKTEVAHEVLNEVFNKLGFELSENDKGLVKIIVDEAIKFVEKDTK